MHVVPIQTDRKLGSSQNLRCLMRRHIIEKVLHSLADFLLKDLVHLTLSYCFTPQVDFNRCSEILKFKNRTFAFLYVSRERIVYGLQDNYIHSFNMSLDGDEDESPFSFSYPFPEEPIRRVFFSMTNDEMLVEFTHETQQNDQSLIWVLDVRNWGKKRYFHTKRVHTLTVRKNLVYVTVRPHAPEIVVYDIDSGQEVQSLPVRTYPNYFVAMSSLLGGEALEFYDHNGTWIQSCETFEGKGSTDYCFFMINSLPCIPTV